MFVCSIIGQRFHSSTSTAPPKRKAKDFISEKVIQFNMTRILVCVCLHWRRIIIWWLFLWLSLLLKCSFYQLFVCVCDLNSLFNITIINSFRFLALFFQICRPFSPEVDCRREVMPKQMIQSAPPTKLGFGIVCWTGRKDANTQTHTAGNTMNQKSCRRKKKL